MDKIIDALVDFQKVCKKMERFGANDTEMRETMVAEFKWQFGPFEPAHREVKWSLYRSSKNCSVAIISLDRAWEDVVNAVVESTEEERTDFAKWYGIEL